MQGYECVKLYLHSPIRLHGVLLSELRDVFMPWTHLKRELYVYITWHSEPV